MIYLEANSNLSVIPRFDVETPIIEVFDEFLETTVVLNYTDITNESGYLIVDYTFNPINNRQYYITIKENTNIAWEGKAMGVLA